jgi:hypothetical protein
VHCGQPVFSQQELARTVVAMNGVNARECATAARDETNALILNTALIFDISFLPLIYPKAGMPFPDQARAEEMEYSPRCKDDLALPRNERAAESNEASKRCYRIGTEGFKSHLSAIMTTLGGRCDFA